jgi:hypothetical protein
MQSAKGSGKTSKLIPCPNLRSLSFFGFGGKWYSYQAIQFLQFPKVDRIWMEWSRDIWNPVMLSGLHESGGWPTPLDFVDHFAQVRHLHVFPMKFDACFISTLTRFVQNAPHLETLEIGSAKQGDYSPSPLGNLNNAVLPCLANTLKRLAIYQNQFGYGDCQRLFGPCQKFVDLDQFVKLEELAAPSFALFGALFMEKREPGFWKHLAPENLSMPTSFVCEDPFSTEIVPGPQYADPTNSGDPTKPDKIIQVAHTTTLPPNLKVLEIYEDPFSDWRWTESPDEAYSDFRDFLAYLAPRSCGKLFRFIKEFAHDFRNRFLKMERVVFWYQDWRGSTPQWTEEEVSVVRDAFRLQGVEFVYKESVTPQPRELAPLFYRSNDPDWNPIDHNGEEGPRPAFTLPILVLGRDYPGDSKRRKGSCSFLPPSQVVKS